MTKIITAAQERRRQTQEIQHTGVWKQALCECTGNWRVLLQMICDQHSTIFRKLHNIGGAAKHGLWLYE